MQSKKMNTIAHVFLVYFCRLWSAGVSGIIFRIIFPAIFFVTIWWPEYDHFRIEKIPLDESIVSRLLEYPADGFLDELMQSEKNSALCQDNESCSRAAESVLLGFIKLQSENAPDTRLMGYPKDLTFGGGRFHLAMASFSIENLLLQQYSRTQDRRYLVAARDRIIGFARWEYEQKDPVGFLWNDHAIAARAEVLINLWRHMRKDAESTLAQRADLLSLVIRSAELLAKKSQFTVRTNHGVMQNLALLQITAAFPEFPKAKQWRRLAAERLELQLRFYVSDEGVILEHSPGYHQFGVKLLAQAEQLMVLNGFVPSNRLKIAIDKSREFNRIITRPDGTVPLIGDTSLKSRGLYYYDFSPERDFIESIGAHEFIYPLSGYAVWWNSGQFLSQTFIAWAKHDRHGHKHADEPSVNFWSRGVDWVTSIGYWPYGNKNFDMATGWLSSNAPHEEAEASNSPRQVQLLASGAVGGLNALDVEVRRASGFTVRRQVVQITSDQFLVLDHASGAKKALEILWTFDARLKLNSINRGEFRTNSMDGFGGALQINIAGAGDGRDIDAELRRGSMDPFGGWVVIDGEPSIANSLFLLKSGGNGFVATLFTVSSKPESLKFRLLPGAVLDDWAIEIEEKSGLKRIRRTGDSIELNETDGARVVKLDPSVDVSGRRKELRDAMSQASEMYPHWRPLEIYHRRAYMLIISIWLLIEISIFSGYFNKRVFWGCFFTFIWVSAFVFVEYFYLV